MYLEITDALPIFQMNDWYPIDKNGDPVFDCIQDEKQEKQKKVIREINKYAVLSAANETDIHKALDTFKRLR